VTEVLLSGRRDGSTHHEVELLSSLPAELRLIGGLAVMCRVGTPHRATVDLDAVARDLPRYHAALARLAVTSSAGGQYRFEGNLDLDVIDVAPWSSQDLIAELSGDEALSDLELNLVAHTWAHDTATPIDIVAVDDRCGERLAAAPSRLVASSAGLVAMKATTVTLRASSRPEKRASDLYDLGRLLVDGHLSVSASASMPPTLWEAVMVRLRMWFVNDAGRDRTYREVHRFDEPPVDLDDVADAVEALTVG
jgi:Nucleotidyl transferase AbiEii toxin, Type IV TA system